MFPARPPAADAATTPGRWADVWERWRGRLFVFSTGQASMQALALLTGLLMIRWMPAEEYAKAGLSLGFQILFGAFVDLGVGSALVALIGGRGSSPTVVGEILAAARWWRRILLAILLPVGALAFLVLYLRHGWSLAEGLLLYGCVAVSLAAAGLNASASAPLLVHQRLKVLYGIGTAGAASRLAGCFALHWLGQLDALSATALNALVAAGCALAAWHAARRHVVAPARSSPAWRDELRRAVAPQVPSTMFYALQGQLTIFLIAWFGQAQHLAEVSALGRLGQLFAFLGAGFSMLVMPACARMPDDVFARRHGWIVAGTLGLTALLCLAGFALPEPLLWLLGPHYAHLRDEVGWMVAGAALGFAGGAVWMVHASRRWVFWSASALYIVSVTLVQAAMVTALDMAVTRNVVLLGVATNATGLLAQAWTAWLGRRRLQEAAAAAGTGAASRASTPA